MDSTELTPSQFRQLYDKFHPMVRELQLVLNRMHELKFPHEDELHLVFWNAQDALNKLANHTRKMAGVVTLEPSESPPAWRTAGSADDTEQPAT